MDQHLLIRERAHRLWEHEDRPQGRALDHWLRAERKVQQAIGERAYRIWERSGYPTGEHLDHWLRAEADVSRSYLLDTSAFIGLGYNDFLRLSSWSLSYPRTCFGRDCAIWMK